MDERVFFDRRMPNEWGRSVPANENATQRLIIAHQLYDICQERCTTFINKFDSSWYTTLCSLYTTHGYRRAVLYVNKNQHNMMTLKRLHLTIANCITFDLCLPCTFFAKLLRVGQTGIPHARPKVHIMLCAFCD